MLKVRDRRYENQKEEEGNRAQNLTAKIAAT
jgi:hypothetical protein